MSLLIFAGKVVVCSGLLYAYYSLVLRNNQFHRYNRYYLLGLLSISVLLPLLQLPVQTADPSGSPVWSSLKSISVVSWEEAVVLTGHGPSSWWNVQTFTWVVYCTGCLLATLPLLRTLLYVNRLRHRYPKLELEGLVFYNTNEPGTPFSFGRMLFWNKEIEPESARGQQILQHEAVHIRSLHTLDIIFSELLAILFWFNPFFHLTRKELTIIHEFLADASASSTVDPFEYAELLVSNAAQQPAVSRTNPFFQQQIKRRIAMIIQHKPTRYPLPRKIMILPVLALVFCSFAIKLKPSLTPPLLLQKPPALSESSSGNDTLAGKEFLERMKKEMSNKKGISMTVDQKSDWIVFRVEGGDRMVTHYSDFLKLAELEKSKAGKSQPVRKSSRQVDEEAGFPGGPQAWMRYLNHNFHYPEEAQAQEIQGTVIIQFNVDKYGTVSNVEVLEGPVLGGLREEGARIIKNSGTWIPASKHGKPVPSVKIQPIIFRLDTE